MMAPIDLKSLTSSKGEIVKITSNYKVLHFDENPILYYGVNEFGTKIIGSHLEDDDDQKVSWNIHTLVTNKTFYNFINRKISYLELLKKSSSIFVTSKTYRNMFLGAYEISFDEIPEEYRPLEDSFCPIWESKKSFAYSLSLKGKLADVNLAIAEEVSFIQNAFAHLLEDIVRNLKGFNLQPKALLEPYTAGSFKINIQLQFEQLKQKSLFTELAPIDQYIQEFIRYLTDGFIKDKELFISNADVEKSQELTKLTEAFKELYVKAQNKPPKDIENEISLNIKKGVSNLEKIGEKVGQNFDSIEFINVTANEDQFISFLDKEYSDILQQTIEEIQISRNELFADDDFTSYSIYIYHLNTDTRQGNALIQNFGEPEKVSKPKIRILGTDPLEESKYTESLHSNKYIKVMAKAKRIGNKYKSLDILFE